MPPGYGSAPNLSSVDLETLAAIVEDAHAANVKVVTHTVTLEGDSRSLWTADREFPTLQHFSQAA